MPKETMTPRERWEAVLRREKPDRVPMGYSATAEASEKLVRHLGVGTLEDAFDRLHVDRVIGCDGRYVGPKPPEGEDIFGCRYRNVSYATGVYWECVRNPLARYTSVEEIEQSYTWPSPDWWDCSHIADDLRGKDHLPACGPSVSPFMWYGYLRGLAQSLADFIEHPDIADYCIDKLSGLDYRRMERILDAVPGRMLFSYVADDFGSQESMLMSPEMVRRLYLPRAKRFVDLLHGAGVYAFHHDDGAIRPIIPDLVAIGFDALNPIQWRCRGMDRAELKRDFGAKLVFHGGMDNQRTIPFGTVEDVRREVIDNLSILGAGGGYILAPCHNIQAVGPAENVVAMYETGYEEGWT